VSECMPAKGWINRDGYVWHWFMGRRVSAHRLAFIAVNGPIPRGMHVLHRCDKRDCVNPDHLYLGTHQQNMADAKAKGRFVNQKKTHCPAGHEYTGENTLVVRRAGSDGLIRFCRTCKRETERRFRLRRREQREQVVSA